MEDITFKSQPEFEQLRELVQTVKNEARKLIVGQERMIELLLIALLADGHVLIEGVPGIAKTLTSRIIAKTINTDFTRLQFTPDLMPSDVLGTTIYNAKTGEFEFKKGPVFSNLVLIDEINRAPAKTQSALFEVMEERQISYDGTTYPMKDLFMILATQNPIEQEGTYRLPEAQLDRFIFKIDVGYPTLDEEVLIIKEYHNRNNKNDLNVIKPLLTPQQLIDLRKLVSSIQVEENLITYIAKLVHSTRESNALYLGASPRASLSVLVASKAKAAINGRNFVTPDDIKFVLKPALNHRILLNPEREMEGLSPADVLQQIIDSIEIPR